MSRYQAEGLRIALEMERRGLSLYSRARQFTRDEALLALLQELAEDEKLHHAQFSAMLEALGEPALGPEENALAAAKAGDFFFPGGLMQAAIDGALHSAGSLLEAAMDAERNSIDFYQRLLEHMAPENRKTIETVLQEEQGHLRSLLEKEKNLGKEETI